MSLLRPVDIQNGTVGVSVSPDAYKQSALIANGVAIAGELVLNTTYVIYRPNDVEAIGLNAAYDTTNNVVLYEHIKEFYRMAGEGVPLYLMVVAQTELPTAMLERAKTLVVDAKGEARRIALAFNPVVSYTETSTDGINSDVRAAIAPAQAFAKWCADRDMPLQVFLEGRAYSGNVAGAINLKALEVSAGVPLEADKVSVCIGQDYGYADARTGALQKKYAAVGNMLGTKASIQVNRNIGEVETLNLTDAVKNIFTQGGLSNHKTFQEEYTNLETLHQKGYIFPIIFAGFPGYRWSGSPVCAPEKEDINGNINESTIELGETLDDAKRKLRIQLLPKVKTTHQVDAATGKLSLGIVKYFESLGDEVLGQMFNQGLISGYRTSVDKESNLLTGDKALKMDFVIVPTGTIMEIQGTINLRTSI